MRVLMVSPFPPLRDGVGKYAAQEVAALRAQGHEVEVLAPVGCAAHFVEPLKGGLRLLTLRRYARRYDRVVLQYQPSHFHTRGSGAQRLASNVGMALTFALVRNMTVVCHEFEHPPTHWRRWRPELVAERVAWTVAAEVAFHTERERRSMREHLGARPRRVVLRDHGEYFRPATEDDRETARRRLGLDAHAFVFLCIGFVQRHKGFDRAVRALSQVPAGETRLAIVGSARDDTPDHAAHTADLRALAAADQRVDLRLGAVSDEEFDRWIVACDAVVLPYREIWSSGVLERAKLLGRPAIVSDVGGLREQAREGDIVVSSDRELVLAMAKLAGHDHVESAPVYQGPQTASDAAAYVREQASLRRGAPARDLPAGRSDLLDQMSRARGVTPVVLPSPRPLVGGALTRVKRVLRRGMGWYIVPMLGQINVFEDRAYDAVADLYARAAALVDDLASLRRWLDGYAADARADHDALRERLEGAASHVEHLTYQVDEALKRFGLVERRTRGLAEIVERGGAAREGAAAHGAESSGVNYFGFESRFRGDPDVIRARQRETYLELFAGAGPVLDVGCGRGEFLDVLRDEGVEAAGVDTDLDMVMECRSRGLSVVHSDGIAHVEGLAEGSLGGVFVSQVVEHLRPRDIVRLLAAARAALRPGGVAVLETINPASLYALANWYTMDLTHAQPVHPNTLAFLAEQEGFSSTEVRLLSPVRESAPDLEAGPEAPEWARRLASTIAAEVRRLDEVVFGPQDYALVARA